MELFRINSTLSDKNPLDWDRLTELFHKELERRKMDADITLADLKSLAADIRSANHASMIQTFVFGIHLMRLRKKLETTADFSLKPALLEFVRVTEGDLRSGKPFFDVAGHVFDSLRSFGDDTWNKGVAGKYSPANDLILVPAKSSTRMLEAFWFETVMHEAWHRFQDLKCQPMHVLQSEFEAFLTSGVLTQLLYGTNFGGGHVLMSHEPAEVLSAAFGFDNSRNFALLSKWVLVNPPVQNGAQVLVSKPTGSHDIDDAVANATKSLNRLYLFENVLREKQSIENLHSLPCLFYDSAKEGRTEPEWKEGQVKDSVKRRAEERFKFVDQLLKLNESKKELMDPMHRKKVGDKVWAEEYIHYLALRMVQLECEYGDQPEQIGALRQEIPEALDQIPFLKLSPVARDGVHKRCFIGGKMVPTQNKSL